MVDENAIRDAIKDVMDPELGRSLLDLGMIKDIRIEGDIVSLSLKLTTIGCPRRAAMAAELEEKILPLGVSKVNITMAEMTKEEKEKAFAGLRPSLCPAHAQADIKKIIAVMSGKGGVGKSAVSALLAVSLAREGLEVGILDADITGPSIPKMFGLKARPGANEDGLQPVRSLTGIKVISMNLLLPREDDAVIWRGPVLSNVVRQLWQDVNWGSLDYLIIDLPPGTADVPLTVMQSLPVSGAILVASPQELVNVVVRKAIQLTRATKIPILGVVENMSYFVCPDSGKTYQVFGPSRAEELSRLVQRPLLARLPIDPELAKLADAGRIEEYQSEAYAGMVAMVSQVLQFTEAAVH